MSNQMAPVSESITDTSILYQQRQDSRVAKQKQLSSNALVVEHIHNIIEDHITLPDWVYREKFYTAMTKQIIEELADAILDGGSLDVTFILGACLTSDHWDIGSSRGIHGLIPNADYCLADTFGDIPEWSYYIKGTLSDTDNAPREGPLS